MLALDRDLNYHPGDLLAHDEKPELRNLDVAYSLYCLVKVGDHLISLLMVAHTKIKFVHIILEILVNRTI